MQLEICLYLSDGDKSAIFLSSSTLSIRTAMRALPDFDQKYCHGIRVEQNNKHHPGARLTAKPLTGHSVRGFVSPAHSVPRRPLIFSQNAKNSHLQSLVIPHVLATNQLAEETQQSDYP